MYKIITLIAIITTTSMASIIDLDAQRKILNARQNLEHISKNSELNPKLRIFLNQLRNDAIELSEIVYSRKCNSVSINSIPDGSCDNFTRDAKKFNDAYAKWTNSFFSSRVTLMKQSKSFRKKVNSCVEMMSAFLNPNMTPESLFPYDLNVNIESRYDTEVNISLTPKYNKKWTFHGNTSGYNRNGEVKYLKKYFMPWTNLCRDIAVDKNGHLDHRYIEKVNQYWENSPYEFRHNDHGNHTGLYVGFKAPRAYVIEILVNGKVYKEVTVQYALTMTKKNPKYYRNDVNVQNFMYLDNLPKEEIRFQLGSPARHQIMHWKLYIDGETSNRTVSNTYSVPEGNIEVRVKN